MADEASSEQKPSTTTVSSVAVQAGDASIVIAVLKCGKWVKLQLAESTPNILEIGSNQDETKKLLQDHEFLLSKLKVRCDKTIKNSSNLYSSGTTADVAACASYCCMVIRLNSTQKKMCSAFVSLK
uniref:Uncharacterized protein n=1 Tax=Cyanistes caeruleus TaxID=156563 RepID=A0A8C0VU10_CYACU